MTPSTAFITAILIAAAALAALIATILWGWRDRRRKHDEQRGDWFAFKDDEEDYSSHDAYHRPDKAEDDEHDPSHF